MAIASSGTIRFPDDINIELGNPVDTKLRFDSPEVLDLIGKNPGDKVRLPDDFYGASATVSVIRPFPWRISNFSLATRNYTSKGGGSSIRWGFDAFGGREATYSDTGIQYGGTFASTQTASNGAVYRTLDPSAIWGEASNSGNQLLFAFVGREPDGQGFYVVKSGQGMCDELGIDPKAVDWKMRFGTTVIDAIYGAEAPLAEGVWYTNDPAWVSLNFGVQTEAGVTRDFSSWELYYV